MSRTQYSELFNVIGTLYGAGDGSTTFNVPNLIDRFVEGGFSSGQYISPGLPNITGSFGDNPDRQTYDAVSGAIYVMGINNSWASISNVSINRTGQRQFDASRSNAIYGASTTVQPNALRMLYIIQYK